MSTSKLQRKVSQLLSIHLGEYTIRENIRPDWLITSDGERLELDFYIEELEVAIEVQGAQHYIHVPFFHGKNGFAQRVKWDNFKRVTCDSLGIKLYEVSNESDALEQILSLVVIVKGNPEVLVPDPTQSIPGWNDREKEIEKRNQKKRSKKVQHKIDKAQLELANVLKKQQNGRHIKDGVVKRLISQIAMFHEEM